MKILIPLQSQILKEKSSLQEKIRRWELDFIENNGCDPLLDDYDDNAWDIYCKRQKAIKLLQYWKIDL